MVAIVVLGYVCVLKRSVVQIVLEMEVLAARHEEGAEFMFPAAGLGVWGPKSRRLGDLPNHQCLTQGFHSCTKYSDQEANFAVHHQRNSGQELTQGRNLEAGANAEAIEGCCLLACFPWLVQLAFLYRTRTANLGVAPPTGGPPLLITN